MTEQVPRLDQNGDPWPRPTRRDLESVAQLTNDLGQEPVASFASPHGSAEDESGMVHLDYGPVMDRLHRLVYDAKLVVPFDWSSWRERARALTEDSNELARAPLTDIQKLLTTHFRLERFCEGHLATIHKSGHLVAVLRRVGELAEGMP